LDQSIHPGDYYEDVFFHPCLCTSTDEEMVTGISLIDGSFPRSCDVRLGGIRKLTLNEVVQWKQSGPQRMDEALVLLADRQWWWPKPVEGINPGEFLGHLYSSSLNYLRNYGADVLGHPIVGWFDSSAAVSYHSKVGQAQIRYRVTGSARSGLVTVDAHTEGRMWPISKIVLDTGAGEPQVFTGDSVRGCGRAD
jgi:hypothetical protein